MATDVLCTYQARSLFYSYLHDNAFTCAMGYYWVLTCQQLELDKVTGPASAALDGSSLEARLLQTHY